MNESSLWALIKANRSKWAHTAIRIEDGCNKGTPDVFAVTSSTLKSIWIELKHAHSLPKRDTTNFSLPHFTLEQRKFVHTMWQANGSGFVFIRVENEFLLLDGVTAGFYIGDCPWNALKEMGIGYWNTKVDWPEFSSALSGEM